MMRLFTVCVLLAVFFASTSSFAMAPGCGCGGSGATCQTNQKVAIFTLAMAAGFYHYEVLMPLASRSVSPALVYAVGYGAPAGAAYLFYRWWNQEEISDSQTK